MQGVVYALIDPLTNQVRYIGQTIGDLSTRLRKHVSYSKSKSTHVSQWIKGLTYKNQRPQIQEIEKVDIDDLDNMEIFYISYYRFIGANLTNISLGGSVRRIHSKEMKEKISKSLTGLKHSEETKKKRALSVAKAWECPILREKQRQRTKKLHEEGILNPRGRESKKKGVKLPDEVKLKLKLALKKYMSNEENRNLISLRNGAKYIQVFEPEFVQKGNRYQKTIVKKGKLIFEHHNINELSRKFNAPKRNISACLKGRRPTCHNYIFEYKK